ncbi:MAG: hypothetical protein KIT84_33295 [Labilithrix sp.]|nr:hypothetical protein [Labilithrix sp.]MCW5815923.1 hypothetical protein [Labilithrix sp.]
MRRLAPLLLGLSAVACNAVVGWGDLTRVRASAEGEEDGGDEEPTDPQKPDAAPKDDAGGPRCDPNKPFGAPVPLAGMSTSVHETGAALTGDELEIFFQRTSGLDGGTILRATRTSIDVDFDPPQEVTELGTSGLLYSPSVTADGLSLFYAQLDPQKGFRIMNATRTTRGRQFDRILDVARIAAGAEDTFPFVTGDGRALFFTRDIAAKRGRIFRAERDDLGEYVQPKQVDELASSAAEESVAVTADGLRVFFGSSRAGGLGEMDIWTARRDKDTDAWSNIELVPNVNTAETDWPHWVSPDGCRLYLSSVGAQPGDIKIATRPR